MIGFFIDKPDRYYINPRFRQKEIFLDFDVSKEEVDNFRQNRKLPGIAKLLTYLENLYGGLDKYKIIFFKGEEDFKIEKEGEQTIVWVNFEKYFEYVRELERTFRSIRIIKKFDEVKSELKPKVPEYYFSKKPIENLKSEFAESKLQIYDELFKTVDDMEEREQNLVLDAFWRTKSASEWVEKIKKLKEDDPELEVKKFIKVVDKLGDRDFQELLDSILNSKMSTNFLKQLMKHIDTKSELFNYIIKWMESLPEEKQKKIAKRLPEMVRLYDRFEKIRKSKKEFEELIERHRKSEIKNEKEIHKFIADNYWLLGVQYTNKKILTDLNERGKYVHQTQFGRLRPDFEISLENMNGTFDSAVLVEIEEANDTVFNKDGTLSYKVFDGINQALKYCIEKRVEGKFVKGIAVIGSVGLKLDENQKKRLFHLTESFHNVEVLTYEDIINRAEATIKFFEEYKKRSDS